jgi:hypothetical protein
MIVRRIAREFTSQQKWAVNNGRNNLLLFA